MKKQVKRLLLSISSLFGVLIFFGATADQSQAAEMHRLYNQNNGEHFYTESTVEKANLVKVGWQDEGIGWISAASEYGDAVYRLYNPNSGEHHYTLKQEESNYLQKAGWRFEGQSFYSSRETTIPVYRLFNPNAREADSHHYTTSTQEKNQLVAQGWQDEGIGWYAVARNLETSGGIPAGRNPDIANVLLGKLNTYRASLGLSYVTMGEELQEMAMVRAMELLMKFSHDRPDGQSLTGEFYVDGHKITYMAEVLTGVNDLNHVDLNDPVSIADGILTNFQNSPPHNNAITASYAKHIGIGVYKAYHEVHGECVMSAWLLTD